jgi:hypothetical protein
MDVGVLEHIEPILAKQTLSSLLVEKNRDVPLRVTSFWNYVAHKNLRPPINAHLQQTLEQLLTRWGEFWHTRFVETR